MNKWVIEVQRMPGDGMLSLGWKPFGYADDEFTARERAAKAFLKASQVYMVRIRRNDS